MCVFWASENDNEQFDCEAAAQNTDSVKQGTPAKWNNDFILRDILISLSYLLRPIFFLLLWI